MSNAKQVVMCDAYTPGGEPILTNKRYDAAKIFSNPAVAAEVPCLTKNSSCGKTCMVLSRSTPCCRKMSSGPLASLREVILDPRLDGHHVEFGKVLSGMDVVNKIEAQGRQSGVPKSKVVISDSGELSL